MSADHSTDLYRVVPGFPRYRVSDDGSCQYLRAGKWRPLKPYLNKRFGTLNVDLRHEGTRKVFKVGQLVLICFVGPKPEGKECCHKDDNKENNHISNLYWGTHSENMCDASRNGTIYRPQGEVHPKAVLTDTLVMEIRRRWREENPRPSQASLARQCGVHPATMQAMLVGRTWRHVP